MLAWMWLVACSGDGSGKDEGTDPACLGEIPYDGIDQDCDGADLVDVDGDSHAALAAGGADCDDNDAAIYPGAAEVPYDGIDQDCADGDDLDADDDGYASAEHGGDDCDDNNPATHPDGLDPANNGLDENCDGIDGVDGDGDGFASAGSGGPDCADDDPARHPDAEEIWYDGIDQNCDEQCDADQDGDGAVLPGSPIGNNSPCDAFPGPEVYAPEDCDDTDATVTRFAIYDVIPDDNAVDIELTPFIAARGEWDGPDPALVLLDSEGNLVAGSGYGGYGYLEFQPAEPLLYSETYQIVVEHACDTFVSSFTTEDEPVPVDASGLLGRTYALDLVSGNWTEPVGLGILLASQLGNAAFLLDVIGVGESSLDLRLATSAYGVQELCEPTSDHPGVDFSNNPYLTVETNALSFETGGYEIPMQGVTLSGRFRSDSASLARLTLDGSVDTRPLVDAFGLGGPPDTLCQLAAAFGAFCVECLDGSGPYCLDVLIEDIPSSEIAIDTVARTEDDIANDPGCP